MARKTLLNEQEIRKFLKLANITTVGEQQIAEMGSYGGSYARDDEEELEDADADADLGDEVEVDVDAQLPVEDEPMVDEPSQDADADLDVGGLDVSDKEELMADVVRAVADALGIADRVDVEAGEEDAMDNMGVGDEPMAMEPEAALAPEEGGEDSLEEPADLDDDDQDPVMEDEDALELSEEDLVSEVARRVAQRLQNDSKKEAMVDTLAERILNRLANK